MLTNDHIRQFKAIYERDSGTRISDQEAGRLAHALVRFYVAIAGPVADDDAMGSNSVPFDEDE